MKEKTKKEHIMEVNLGFRDIANKILITAHALDPEKSHLKLEQLKILRKGGLHVVSVIGI